MSLLGICAVCNTPVRGMSMSIEGPTYAPCGHPVPQSAEPKKREPITAAESIPRSDDNPFGKPDRCRECPLFREPGIVPNKGPKDHHAIFAIGERPEADEVDAPNFRAERMGPFQGGSGRILSILMAHAGINRREVWIGNAVKCRTPMGQSPSQAAIQACWKNFVRDEVESSPANVILALGEIALNVLTGKKGIGLYRGVPTEGPGGRKVFPTWNPAFIIKAQHQWAFAVHDLARAAAQSAFPEIRRVPIEVIRQADVGATRADLLGAIRRRRAATFDFETTGLSPQLDSIRMCGFAGGPDKAYVYDWTTGAQQVFDEILRDPSIEVCGQNILYFDLPFAEAKGGGIWTSPQIVSDLWSRRVFDTMVAFHLCNSSYGQTSIASQNKGSYQGARGAEKDLAFIASVHTDMEYWKGRDNYRDDIYTVCGKDVLATDRSAYDPETGIKAELERYGMLDLYYKHVLPVHLPLHRMHQRGMRIDQEQAGLWMAALLKMADDLEATLREGVGDPYLNLNSPKQLMDLLYVKLGLPIQYTIDQKTKQRRPTANGDAIDALVAEFPEHAVLSTIADIRNYRKMESTYLRKGHEFGWLHPRFGVSKAANGRFNSQDPNAQNVPEDMRVIWVPDDDDCVILSADASQIEWRTAMVLSGDPVGLELLASGVDNHRAVAAETLGRAYTKESLDSIVTDAERHAAKFIVYGLGYGRGARSISEGHNLPMDFVEKFISRFFSRFSTFYRWRERLVNDVEKNHFIANPWGRRRWWFSREITEVYNYPASSTAADMMIDEIILLEQQLPKGATLRLTVHDEVVLNVPKDIIKPTAECVRDIMQMKWPKVVDYSADPATVKRFYPNGWYCPADVHIGSNWAMCKSKNPELKAARAALEKHLNFK